MPAMPEPAARRRIWETREWKMKCGGAARSSGSAGCQCPSLLGYKLTVRHQVFLSSQHVLRSSTLHYKTITKHDAMRHTHAAAAEEAPHATQCSFHSQQR